MNACLADHDQSWKVATEHLKILNQREFTEVWLCATWVVSCASIADTFGTAADYPPNFPETSCQLYFQMAVNVPIDWYVSGIYLDRSPADPYGGRGIGKS